MTSTDRKNERTEGFDLWSDRIGNVARRLLQQPKESAERQRGREILMTVIAAAAANTDGRAVLSAYVCTVEALHADGAK